MESTHEFVEKLNENQKKAEKNKRVQGKNGPATKLPNKQHNQGY